MKILVIGSSGYIGKAVSESLKKDYNVDGCDINWFSNENVNFNFDYKLLKNISDYDYVLLFAGHSSVTMCLDNYYSAWENNVVNFSYLIKKLNENQVLIYASSAGVYGSDGGCYTEEYTFKPFITEYDLTKQLIEKITIDARCKTIGLRLGTVNGCFSYNVRSDLLLNHMVKNAIENNKILCSNRDELRSILGINDLVRAVKEIIKKKDISSNIYNLASFSDTIGNFAEICSSVFNIPVDYLDDTTSKYSFKLNCDKFSNEFDFSFDETPFTVINSIKNNFQQIVWTKRNIKKTYE